MAKGSVRLLAQTDKRTIETFLRTRPADPHLLADLESFIWDQSRWWGLGEDENLRALVCLIEGPLPIPILCAIAHEGDPFMARLLNVLEPRLPPRMLVQSPVGMASALPNHSREMSEPQLKMVLAGKQDFDDEVVRLGMEDMDEITKFLSTAYREDEPDTRFFEPYMLEAWPHVGHFRSGTMLAFGGTHIFSKLTGAACIGNIVTHPTIRGQGLGSRITRSLCAALQNEGATCIGLNVDANNYAAKKVYKRVGFSEVWQFDEFLATRMVSGDLA